MAPQPVNPWQVVYGTRAAHLRAVHLPDDDTRLLIATLRAWRNETFSSAPPDDQRAANLIVTLTRTLPRTLRDADPTPGLWTLTRALRALHDPPTHAPTQVTNLPGLNWQPVQPGAHHRTYARLTGDSAAAAWYHLPDPHSAATLDLRRRGDHLHGHLHLHAAPQQAVALHATQVIQDALAQRHPDAARVTASMTVTRHRSGLSVSLQDFLTELRRQLH